MLTLNSHKKIIIWVAVITIIILSLILPINIKYNIYVKGKLLPNKEWIIYKGTDGRLTSLITNYRTGMNQSYDVTLFDRGDAMRFSFNQKLHSGSRLFVNDTVAIVYSNEIERQIENLKGEIIAAKASLSLNLTGEKEAIIEQENKTLDYSIKQSEEQKKILDRVKTLYDKGLASLEEYEIAKGTYELNVINSSISKARFHSVQTGEKKEKVSLIRFKFMFRIPTNRETTHPGEMLLEEFLVPMGVSQKQLADAMQVPFQRVNEIVNRRRGVTPETALRLAKVLGMSPSFWLKLQMA